MSASIWSLDTAAGTGVMASAIHTLGEGWFGPAGTDVPLSLTDPSVGDGIVRISLADPAGAFSLAESPMFMMFNPAIPSGETGNGMRDIFPRHDFFVAALDDQQFGGDGSHIGFIADPLHHAPPRAGQRSK